MAALYTHHTGFSSSPSLPIQHPSTPPYTPLHAKRSRLFASRPASPASLTSSIHPAEQESPARKGTPRQRHLSRSNDYEIEEIEDGDIGYQTDVDLVHPYELEERDTEGEETDDQGDSDEDDEEFDGGIARRVASMTCDDEDGETADQSRHRGLQQRTGSRIFKRSHSQSIKGEHSDAPLDTEAMCDHDLDTSARRLRRRVRGPPVSASVGATPQGSRSPAQRFRHLRRDIPRSSPDSFRTAPESAPASGYVSPQLGYTSVNMMDDDSDDEEDDLMTRIRNAKEQEMDLDDGDEDDSE